MICSLGTSAIGIITKFQGHLEFCCEQHKDEWSERVNDMDKLGNYDCRQKYGMEIEAFRQEMKNDILKITSLQEHQSIHFQSNIKRFEIGKDLKP